MYRFRGGVTVVISVCVAYEYDVLCVDGHYGVIFAWCEVVRRIDS